MEIVNIKEDFIKLSQFLKYMGIVSTGGEVKHFIEENNILLNDVVVFEIRKKIYDGDILKINDDLYKIIKE